MRTRGISLELRDRVPQFFFLPSVLIYFFSFLAIFASASAQAQTLFKQSNLSATRYEALYTHMMEDPWDFNSNPLPWSTSMFQDMIGIYQRYGSKGRNRCQFSPSCSRYSYLAIEADGPLVGISKSFDRLWRCTESAPGHYHFLSDFLFDPPHILEPLEYAPSGARALAANTVTIDDSLAAWLDRNREWPSLYQRLLEIEHQSPSAANRLKLAETSLNLGDPRRALFWLEPDSSRDAILTRSVAYYRLNMFDPSQREAMKIAKFDRKAAALWLHSYMELPMTNSSGVDEMFSNLGEGSETAFLRENMLDALSGRSGSKTFSLIQSIVVPGLGQMTSGAVGDGLYALAFVGGFGYLTYKNIVEKEYGEAALFGLGFAFTYSANLIAAWNAPERRYVERTHTLHSQLNRVYDPGAIFR